MAAASKRVRMDSAYHRAVPCSLHGTVLEHKIERFGPGTYTVLWDNGVTSTVSGYHVSLVGDNRPTQTQEVAS